MSKILTAEEFLNKYDYPSMRFCNVCMNFEQDLQKMLIEFAKLHVEAALKEASKSKSLCTSYTNDGLDYKEMKLSKESILNVYPLENIK